MSDKNYEILYLKSIYGEILQGYTHSYCASEGAHFYFKHLSPKDFSNIDLSSYNFQQKAIENGAPTRDEKISLLKEEDMWPFEDEQRTFELKDIISRQKNTIKKLKIPSQIEALQREIKKNSEELSRIEGEINELIGFTAEAYASSKINEVYIYYSCYSSPELQKLKYDKEQFDELSNHEVGKIASLYNKKMGRIDSNNIKKIAVSDFFTSVFSICKDNPMTYYGRPVVELSNFQSELFVFGLHYKHILNKHGSEIPDDIRYNPDELTNYHEMKENIANNNQNLGVDTSKNFSMVGATKEDYKKMGIDSEGISLSKIARERGRPLSMKDLMELEGKKMR